MLLYIKTIFATTKSKLFPREIYRGHNSFQKILVDEQNSSIGVF